MANTKNLVGTYSIPASLARELHKEDERDLAVSDEQLKESIKSQYQKQSHLLTDRINAPSKADRKRLRLTESTDSAVAEISSSTTRRRRRRWDVTPEEREKLLLVEKDPVLKNILENKVPIIGSIPLTDEVLDAILPAGYVKALEPAGAKQDIDEVELYQPLSTDTRNNKTMEEVLSSKLEEENELMFFRAEDRKYFGKLELIKNENKLSAKERKEINVMRLLLRIKNGVPAVRKKSIKLLSDTAKQLGPEPLFGQLLPILVEPSLEDSERHTLIKLIGRLLFRFDVSVRPYTHKILMAVSPLLIDEDFTLRFESREIIAQLAKVVGLAHVVSTLRPDLGHQDEYVRNVTSRIFAIVSNTLGLVNFIPFLRAVIRSKKSWQVKHTGIKIIQQICNQLGAGNGQSILPYLPQLTDLLKEPLSDEMMPVKNIAAQTLAQLADIANPYGAESFETVLEPLWVGLKRHRGRGLSSFMKSLGSIIAIMSNDPNYEEYSNYYTREVINVISREFNTQDDELKGTILRVLPKLPLNRKLLKHYKTEIVDPFFRCFWNRRSATDTKLVYRLVVTATTELALKLNYLMLIERLIVFMKDENLHLRRMSIEAVGKIVSAKPTELIGMSSRLQTQLVDGVLFAFQEQETFDKLYLKAVSVVASALGLRLKPHINSILSTVLYQIKNKSPDVRQQAALLIAAISPVIKVCAQGDNTVLLKLNLILYESLGEVYPDVLASVITALAACLDTFTRDELLELNNPSINQILPSLSPILKNRHEKVQESTIQAIGLIARKCADVINAKEWMRICFDLLDTLKSPRKRIRVAANKTFGEIAKTIGPQDVLSMLLNNLRVQERQLRVCTAVAIGIVAEVCGPFTVIPAIMNEYRTPDKNVQNGVLKAMTFLFEYIEGSMSRDYLYAITTLLQDALTDRDQVHRQTAATVVKNLALNCQGTIHDQYIEVFMHLLNLLMPNLYETSPHVISRIVDAIDSIKGNIGVGRYMNYIMGGLFHPAKRVREPFWKLYNAAYIQSADAMVPYYPSLDNLGDGAEETYSAIEELDLFL